MAQSNNLSSLHANPTPDTPKFDNSDQDNAGIKSWTNLNSFAARVLGAEITDWDNFAIWGLREALETPPQNDLARDAHLAVAYEWIAHAGKQLHEKSKSPQTLDEPSKRALKPGKLFESGESGLSVKRWDFWRERLEALSKEAGSEEAKTKAQKAAEIMKSA